MNADKRAAPSWADDIAVNAKFVTALAEDWAKHGPVAIEALRLANPARYLMMMAALLFDDRYAGAFDEAEGATEQ
jgi:hypothetical protein